MRVCGLVLVGDDLEGANLEYFGNNIGDNIAVLSKP